MKIEIPSILALINLLSGLTKFVEGSRISISNRGCKILAGNKAQTIRVFINSNVMRLFEDKHIELNFKETIAFIRALQLIIDMAKTRENIRCVFEYQEINGGTFITFSGNETSKAKFKIKLDSKFCTDDYVTMPLKTTTILTPVFSWNINSSQISMLSKYSTLNNGLEVKTYFYVENDVLFADLDNKLAKLISSATIPIASINDCHGTLSETLCADLNSIKLWTMLNDMVKVSFTDKNCFLIESETTLEDTTTQMKMITTKLKG